MKILGNILVAFGLLFIGLGCWEKIYLYSIAPPTDNMIIFMSNTADYFWNLTNITIGFGMILFIVGIVMALKKSNL